MKRGICGEECAHPGIVTTLDNLELVYHDQGKLGGRSLKMSYYLYVHARPHPRIATRLLYFAFGLCKSMQT